VALVIFLFVFSASLYGICKQTGSQGLWHQMSQWTWAESCSRDNCL